MTRHHSRSADALAGTCSRSQRSEFTSARSLPTRTDSVAGTAHFPAWLFVAAHGGSGASLLARMSRQPWEHAATEAGANGRPFVPTGLPTYGMNAGRAWPDPQREPTRAVVVVCRTTMRGLAWARDVAAQHAANRTPQLDLLGLVAVADQPGRLPRQLASSRSLLRGAYRRVWDVPYVPEYRLLTGLPGEPCPPTHPAIDDVLTAIRSAATPNEEGLAS